MSKFRYAIKTFMPCRYTDKNDLMHRVNSTFVKYEDVIYIAQLGNFADSRKMCINLLSPIDGSVIKKIDINDTKLDISAMEIGYYTDFGLKRAYHMRRSPSKRYTQGLTNQNTFRATIAGENCPGWEMFNNHGLVAALYGKFTPYGKALEFLDTKRLKSVALSPEVAIEGTESGLTMVYVKTNNVGYLTENRKLVIPEKKNSWVAQKYVDEILEF